MDLSSLENFKREINQIREYIEHIQYVNDVVNYSILDTDSTQINELLNTLGKHYRLFNDRKIFEYKAIIISLYGILEKFVEIWIREYLNTISKIVPEYNQLDEKIRENHFELSLKLISAVTGRESAKYQYVTKEQILKKLNHCLENSINYQFNTEAFVLLSGNLKHNKIVELFGSLNIDFNRKFKTSQTFIEYCRKKYVTNIANRSPEFLLGEVNELVERRNEIAHDSTVKDCLSPDILKDYVQSLENYCQAIFEILREESIKQESIHKFQKIEKIIDIYNNRILAFEMENYEIKVGDIIIVETAEGNFFEKPILEIQIDNKPYPQIIIKNKTNVAVKLEPNIKKNQKFFIKNKNAYNQFFLNF